MASPGPLNPTPLWVSRGLVLGNPDVVTADNYRGGKVWYSDDEARAYAIGGGIDPQIAAIVRYLPEQRQTKRRSWSRLSARTQKRYAGSRQAQAEAAANNMSLREWFEVAPDIKAFRGHAPARRVRGIRYALFVARDYESMGLSRQKITAMRTTARKKWTPEMKRDAAEMARRVWGERKGQTVAEFISGLETL